MDVVYAPEAIADLAAIPERFRTQILRKLGRLRAGLSGDIKRLHACEPIYRLRSGDYRAIFTIGGGQIDVLKVKHRREVYD